MFAEDSKIPCHTPKDYATIASIYGLSKYVF